MTTGAVLGHVGDAGFLPTCWIVGSSYEAGIGVLYFWRIGVAVRKRQNAIVLTRVEA
ncbi:MAG: hypothetical protein ABWZ54_01635 [Luteibacter sp.]